MQYSLMIYQTELQFADRTNPARRDANNAAFGRYVGSLHEAGVLVTTLGIEPPQTAASVRVGDTAPRVLDGPSTHANEYIGGLCVIDVPNRDSALEWAARAPFDHCASVEVRPTRVVPA